MNDDDVDFKPSQSTSSNLTSLFGTNRPRPTDNQTLTYTPPKPPKAGESSVTPVRRSSSRNSGTEKLEIIVSTNIQLYKLENGKYVGQGVAGIAIIGHHDFHVYQIILYKNNKEYLSKSYVQPNFIFTVLENNYASFYDNARQNWSILFPSSSDVQHFAKQVAIAKYNSQSKQDKIIVQDLIPIGSARANEHDIVTLDYSCSLLNNDYIIPLKEKTNWSIVISDSYTFPWQEGLRECGYRCKRVVITPYKLSAPWVDEIPENNSVLVEFEVQSIRPPERLGQNKTSSVKPETQDESTTDSSKDEDNCKVKPISIKDSIFLSRSHKADLISRIAKVGQALPLKVAFACGPSDTSTENSTSRQANNLKCADNAGHQQMYQEVPSNFCPCSPQHTDTHQPCMLSTSPGRRCENDIAFQQQQMCGGLNFAYQELHPLTSGPPGPSGHSNMRGQDATGTDAELRITINKVSKKVDHVLNKLQNFDAPGRDKIKAHQSATVFDPMSVINSIQDVMAENESLKAEIQEQKSKINEQGNKLHSLMELTQRCVESCAYPERKPVGGPSTDKIVGLEERLNISDQLMMEANTRMNQLTCEIEKYRKEITENQQQIRQCNMEIQSLVDKLKEKERVIRNMEKELVETAAENEILMSGNEMQKKEVQRSKREDWSRKSSEPQPAASEDSVEEIKKVMNAINRKLQSDFDSDQFYSGKHIKATIAGTLKDGTMEYLKYRTKQKNASRVDVGQRDLSGISGVQLPSDNNAHNPETAEADDRRREKSKVSLDLAKIGSQRLAFTDDQPLQPTTNVTEKLEEKPVKLLSQTAQESSVRIPTLRRTPELSTISTDFKAEESLHPTDDSSAVYHDDVLRSPSSRPIVDTSGSPTPDVSMLIHDMKSAEAVRGGSQRESDVSERNSGEMRSRISQIMSLSPRLKSMEGHSGEHSGATSRGSSTTSTRTLLPASKTSVIQPSSRRSTVTTSRPPSGGDESVRGDIPTMTGELESLLKDHETENVEVEKSNVTLTNTLSDVTRGSTAPPSSFRSTISTKTRTSSLDMGSSNRVQGSATHSTVIAAEQSSETDEEVRKKLSDKSGSGVSEEKSFRFVGREESNVTNVESSRVFGDSETSGTPGRSVLTVKIKLSETDDGTGRQIAGTSSSTVAGEKSYALVNQENSKLVTDTNSHGVINQESGIQEGTERSTVMSRALTSEMDVSVSKYEVCSKSGTEDEERGSDNTENNKFGDASANAVEGFRHSLQASHENSLVTEGKSSTVRKSESETDLECNTELCTPVEKESIANVETEKSSILLNKTVLNATKDTSVQGPVEPGNDYSSLRKDFDQGNEDKSQLLDEEKNNLRDEMNDSNKNGSGNKKDEREKSSIDKKVSSSPSDENFNSSGSNTINELPVYFGYYQGWESSKPPPLPLEDDEESSGTDEEWL